MKKNYTLLSGLVLASCFAFAQNKMSNTNMASFEVPAALSSEAKSADPDFLKKAKQNAKEPIGSRTEPSPATCMLLFFQMNEYSCDTIQ